MAVCDDNRGGQQASDSGLLAYSHKSHNYHQSPESSGLQPNINQKSSLDDRFDDEFCVVKRKTEVCYYVMKLAEYGELYGFIEHTDRFSEEMTRYILDQIIDGMRYLHSHGIIHKDIKPENLLINRKGKIIIADFSFATRMVEIESDELF